MSSVLDTLGCDHANFSKLLNVIERQAEMVAKGADPDLEVLNQAVEYLEGYPAAFHHPMENALYGFLKCAAPSCSVLIDRIVEEHIEVRSRLLRFKALLENIGSGNIVARSTFSTAAQAFVDAEWAHMEFERAELFPAARVALTADEWAALERAVPPTRDVLFEANPQSHLLRLHEALSHCNSAEEVSDRLDA